jgi:hypothetical protein
MSTAPEAAAGGASVCARCGARFECGMQAGTTPCWCTALPPLDPVPGQGCLCPTCLRAALAAAPGAPAAPGL